MNDLGFTCLLAGPGRGDCLHFVGLPGKSIPGEHDGPDDTVDVYGKPNGWCWSCWRGYQIMQLRHDIQAYRAALGYSVPGDHDGKLSDGTTPQCGMCNSEYRKNLEAKCAEMDQFLRRLPLVIPPSDSEYHAIMSEVSRLCSSDCGKGWRSPEEYGLLQAKFAQMREVLLTLNHKRYLLAPGHSKEQIDFIRSVNAALSSDCGRGWIPVTELEPTLNWFNLFLGGYEPEIAALRKLHPGHSAGEVCACDVVNAFDEFARLKSLVKGAK